MIIPASRTIKLIILIVTITVCGYSQTFQWVEKSGGASFRDLGKTVDVDSSDNVYMAASFADTAWVGSNMLIGSSTYAGFIAKYNSSGGIQWAKGITSTGIALVQDISVTEAGDIFVTGYFNDTATFGSTSIIATGTNDFFLAKYNTSGALLWLRTVGAATATVEGNTLSKVVNGNIYVGGMFSKTITFGSSSPVTSHGGRDIFIAKYDTAGNAKWVSSGGTKYNQDYAAGISVTNSEDIYITGNISDPTATFGSTIVNAPGTGYIYIAKSDSAGNFIWIKTAGGTSYQYGRAIFVNDSAVYVAGEYNTDCMFDTVSLTSNGYDDLFFAKYNHSGTLQWIKSEGGTNFETARSIYVDSAEDIYLCGGFSDTVNFAGTNLISYGHTDIFVAKYNSSRNLQWIRHGGGTVNDHAWGLAYNGPDDIYVTGAYSGTAFFGSNTIVPVVSGSSSSDIFLTRISFPPPSGMANNDNNNTITVYPNPAKENLFITTAENRKPLHISLNSIEGKTVYSEVPVVSNNSIILNISSYTPGIYILNITYENEVSFKKLVIQ